MNNKKKHLETLTFLIALFLVLAVASCGKEEEEENNSSGKELVSDNINNKEFVFNKDGERSFSALLTDGKTMVMINSTTTSIAYDQMKPSCSHKKTGKNTALYKLQFAHKVYVPLYQNYTYGFNYYELNLAYTSPTGGTYTGTRKNGQEGYVKNVTGTFLINIK